MSSPPNPPADKAPPPVPDSQRRVPREQRPARRGPFGMLYRYVGNRIFLLLVLLVIIFGGMGSCALFLPTIFHETIQAVQGAGLSVYTVILGVTGNSALQLVTYQGHVTAQTQIKRDMGVLSLLYGESAEITGTVTVSLGADLKNKTFGILSCDIDPATITTNEQRAPLSGNAFDPQSIKQAAYAAFETQAAQQAIANYWPQARAGLQSQFASWALGLTAPAEPTVTTCPGVTPNGSAATAVPTP